MRQGQKLKAWMIHEGFIVEEIRTTHSGKLRVVSLTDWGRMRLDEQSQKDPPDP